MNHWPLHCGRLGFSLILGLPQDSRPNVEFPLGVSLVLQSCAAIYLNQTWLEVMDFVMNGVLGDGPWCPWLLVPEPKVGLGHSARFELVCPYGLPR